MKLKIFLNALVFTLVMVIIYSMSYLVPSWTGLDRYIPPKLLEIIRFLLSCTWLLGITYNVLWNQLKARTTGVRFLFFFIFILSILLTWMIQISYKLTLAYDRTKHPSRGWKGIAHETDMKLGLKPIPNVAAFHTFGIGEDVPMKYDENGFRVPLSYDHSKNINNKPRILFLGCSFTYGDASLAEETFPFIIEKKLNCYSINAGVCSYGLSQMYIQAQTLIPQYKPDIVVFQNSPWLVERALAGYGPVYLSVLPTPYFDSNNNMIYPLFESNLYKYPTEYFKQTKESFSDYLSFMHASFPLAIWDDFTKFKFDMKQLFHQVPKPNTDSKSVEKFVFKKVEDLCDQYNCKMIALDISMPKYKAPIYKPEPGDHILIANADSSLKANLGKNESYDKKYCHYRMSGNDSVMVDSHPNTVAHEIIADELIRVINQLNVPKN